jgi:hypothetical protein
MSGPFTHCKRNAVSISTPVRCPLNLLRMRNAGLIIAHVRRIFGHCACAVQLNHFVCAPQVLLLCMFNSAVQSSFIVHVQ